MITPPTDAHAAAMNIDGDSALTARGLLIRGCVNFLSQHKEETTWATITGVV
jgi:hypothetical protein